MSNQRYSPEFKDEAVRQIVDRGYSVTEVSEHSARWTIASNRRSSNRIRAMRASQAGSSGFADEIFSCEFAVHLRNTAQIPLFAPN